MYEAGGLLFILSMPVYCFLMSITYLTTLISRRKGQCKSFMDLLMWRIFIRIVMINYLPLLIASGIGHRLRSSALLLRQPLFLIFIFLALFTSLLFGLFVESKEMASPSARKHYYSLFREVEYQMKWASLHTFFWLIRRTITVIIMQIDLFPVRLSLLLTL